MALFAKAQPAAAEAYIHPQTFKSLESFNHDGMEIARRRKARRALPWQHAIYFAIAILAFKTFLVLEMGSAAYSAKANELMAAQGLERLAGHAMQIDPATQWIVDKVRFGF